MKKISVIALVLFTVVVTNCHNPDDYVLNIRKQNTDVLLLSSPDQSIPADNFQIAPISAFIPVEAAEETRDVTFETDAGVFEENDQKKYVAKASLPIYIGMYANTLAARATLRSSNTVGPANVTATIGGVTQRVQLLFVNAYPESIRTETSSFEIKSGYNNEITLSATLSRMQGLPSAGNKVDFTVTDLSGNAFPQTNFRNVNSLSDVAGKSSAIFTAGGSAYTGLLRVIASASNGTTTISDTTYVNKN